MFLSPPPSKINKTVFLKTIFEKKNLNQTVCRNHSLKTTVLFHDAFMCKTIVLCASHVGCMCLQLGCTIYMALKQKWDNTYKSGTYSSTNQDAYIYMSVSQLSKG